MSTDRELRLEMTISTGLEPNFSRSTDYFFDIISQAKLSSLPETILTKAGFCEHRILAKALLGVTAMFTINRSG
jgi:hypothetical protein